MKLGRYQASPTFESWKGLTTDNALGALFQSQPQKASNIMVQLLTANRGRSLETWLSQFPTKEFETDDEYTWDVIGSARKNVPLIEARVNGSAVIIGEDDVDEDTLIGSNTCPFELVFAEDWFADGEYIVGNLNEIYQFRILGNAKMEGTNAVYTVELAGGNIEGVPAKRLQAGERFSVEAAFVEREMSRKVGDIRFSSPTSMRNEFSTVRIQHKVAGNKINKKLAFGIPMVHRDASGKQVKDVNPMWMHYVDWEMELQFSEYKTNALAWGRSNRNSNGEYTNFGKSGYVIKTGAGLYEQLEVANTIYYNEFDLALLEDALYEISTQAGLGFGERKFIMRTGEMGAKLFHKAVLNEVSGWTQFTLDNASTKVVSKASSALHSNALSAGFQFTEFKAPNGVILSVEVDPYYDDKVRNKILHPDGGVAMSYRFDIMYVGTSEQPNIFKCGVKGQPELRGYEWGFRNPFTGQLNNGNMSFDEDSAIMHKMATLGVCVLDPTRTISLIPDILAE